MQKPLVGIAIPALILAGGVALYSANSGGNGPGPNAANEDPGTVQQCVALGTETGDITLPTDPPTTLPAAGKPSLCVTYMSDVKKIPTVSLLRGCGPVCAAVNVTDIDVATGVGIEFKYTLNGEERSTTYNPSPAHIKQEGEEACVAVYDPTQKPNPCEVVLTAPQSITATASSTGQVDLSWAASEETHGRAIEIVYEIYRSETNQSDSFVLINTVPELSFTDVGLTPNRTYYYYLVATDDDGHKSSGSELVSVTVQ